MSDAVAWHDVRAASFEAAYIRSSRFQERRAVWSAAIGRWLRPGAAVLDAGCGPGVLTELAAGTAGRILAFDASAEMVARARQRLQGAGVEVRELRLEQAADLAQGGFDLVLCSSVLEYVEDLDGALEILVAALTPGGVLLVSTPNGVSLYRWAERALFALVHRPRYFAHVRHLPSPGGLSRRLQHQGLEVLDQVFYGRAPLLSAVARAFRAPILIDTLVLTAARRLRADA